MANGISNVFRFYPKACKIIMPEKEAWYLSWNANEQPFDEPEVIMLSGKLQWMWRN